MPLSRAYLMVVLIWSTTPLALKWSTELGFLTGLTARMALAAGVATALLLALGRQLPVHGPACRLYWAGGASTYASLYLTYWSAQYVPSGWISVVFGLAPIFNSVLGAVFLAERALNPVKVISLLVSAFGLAFIFHDSLALGPNAAWGIGALTLAALVYSASMIWIKRINANVDSYATMTGSTVVAMVLFAAHWALTGAPVMEAPDLRTVGSVVYLGVMSSVVAYSLFYYLLRHLDTTRIAMTAMITPVLSLLIGHFFNGERLNVHILAGTLLVMAGLFWFQFHDRIESVVSAWAARSRRKTVIAPAPHAAA